MIAERLGVVLLLIAGLTVVFGRFFCGWICPFALYMDLITRLRKIFKIPYWNLPDKINNALHVLRYAILGAILLMVLVLGYINPDMWRLIIMFMGPFKSLIIVFLLPLESIHSYHYLIIFHIDFLALLFFVTTHAQYIQVLWPFLELKLEISLVIQHLIQRS